MSHINDLVDKALNELNENAKLKVERRVKELVGLIIQHKSEIARLNDLIKGFQDELSKIQEPELIKLD